VHRFRAIRALLDVTQQDMAEALGVRQSFVSVLDRGGTLTPPKAAKLIAYAQSLGVVLTYEQIYGRAQLPPPRLVRRNPLAVV
jgi:transcriptional regulator with XRE-family HTH domain